MTTTKVANFDHCSLFEPEIVLIFKVNLKMAVTVIFVLLKIIAHSAQWFEVAAPFLLLVLCVVGMNDDVHCCEFQTLYQSWYPRNPASIYAQASFNRLFWKCGLVTRRQ
jgi:hypothetical protein